MDIKCCADDGNGLDYIPVSSGLVFSTCDLTWCYLAVCAGDGGDVGAGGRLSASSSSSSGSDSSSASSSSESSESESETG